MGITQGVQIAAVRRNLNLKITFAILVGARYAEASEKVGASGHTKCLPYTNRILIILSLKSPQGTFETTPSSIGLLHRRGQIWHLAKQIGSETFDSGVHQNVVHLEVDWDSSRVLNSNVFGLMVEVQSLFLINNRVSLLTERVKLCIGISIVIELRVAHEQETQEVLRIKIVGVPGKEIHFQLVLIPCVQ